MHVADNARLENRKIFKRPKNRKDGSILTIFGPTRSQRRKLFHETFSNERNEQKVPENFEKSSKNRKILKIDIADVINY